MASPSFPKEASPLAAPLALAASAVVGAFCSPSFQLSTKAVAITAACFPVAWAVFRKVLPRSASTAMRMTAMEDSMARCDAFSPTTKLTQINNIINGFMWFDECPSVEDVVESFEKVLRAHKRFRSVPKRMHWELVETKACDHVGSHEAATEEAAVAQLFEIANTKELPKDRPFWRLEVVRVPPPGRSVVLMRIHHVLGDGIGLFELVMPLMSTDLEGKPVNLSLGPMPKGPGGLLANILWYLDAARSFVKVLGSSMVSMETDIPWLTPTKHRDLVYSGKREVVFFPDISLSFVKKVKEAANCTVNDVMYAAWAGAVRRHCEAGGFVFQKNVTLRTLLPVAIPRTFADDHDPEDRLVNYFTFVPVSLDLNSTDPKKRLRENKKNLDVVKKTTIAKVSLWVVNNFTPLLPTFLSHSTAQKIFSRHSVVFSNVPGSKMETNIFGKRVSAMQAVFINVIPQVIAISYGDKICMNLTADPEIVKPLQEFPQHYLDELDALGRAFGVEGTVRCKA